MVENTRSCWAFWWTKLRGCFFALFCGRGDGGEGRWPSGYEGYLETIPKWRGYQLSMLMIRTSYYNLVFMILNKKVA